MADLTISTLVPAAYTSIAAWSFDIKAIASLTEDERGLCIDDNVYARGDQSDTNMSSLTFNGFVVTLKGDGDGINDGDFGNGARTETASGFGGLYQSRDITIEDFSFTNTEPTQGGSRCFLNSETTTYNRVIARTLSSGGNSQVFQLSSGGPCVLESFRVEGGTTGIDLGNASTILKAGTVIGSDTGINASVINTGTIQNVAVYNSITSCFSGTFDISGTYNNNASEDNSHPGTSGVLIVGDPFDPDGYTPASGGQLDGAGANLGILLDAANLPFDTIPPIGGYNAIGAELDIEPTGIASTLAFGTPTVEIEADIEIFPSGIASTVQFGIPIIIVVSDQIADAPPERTFTIDLEDRVYDIKFEDRVYSIEAEDRVFKVLAGNRDMKRIPKDPSAILNYSFDLTDWLETGDTILSFLLFDSTGITVDSSSNTDTIITAIASGGTAQKEETLTCRFSTVNGLSDDRTIIFEMGNR